MVRLSRLNKEKKKKILISVDKSIYFFMKGKKIKISTYINQMLKVAFNNPSENNFCFCGSVVERNLGKVEVAGSIPARSFLTGYAQLTRNICNFIFLSFIH
jgi:hypothetical protein